MLPFAMTVRSLSCLRVWVDYLLLLVCSLGCLCICVPVCVCICLSFVCVFVLRSCVECSVFACLIIYLVRLCVCMCLFAVCVLCYVMVCLLCLIGLLVCLSVGVRVSFDCVRDCVFACLCVFLFVCCFLCLCCCGWLDYVRVKNVCVFACFPA